MKAFMQPVDMLAWFDTEGNSIPIRFRIKNAQDEDIVVRIDKIFSKEKYKLGGNYIIRFDCRAVSYDKTNFIQLQYEMGSCKWYLAKM